MHQSHHGAAHRRAGLRALIAASRRRPGHSLAFVLAALLVVGRARAGGFEIPDTGTEALGRGGAFTAKADDATALVHNVAGLAAQRGTRVLVDAHSILSSYAFQRAGVYPDDPRDPATPWGGKPFPRVSSQTGFFVAPMVAVTSDLGLDRVTFALGAYGPSGVPNRTYPLGVEGKPSPARYDLVQSRSILVLPTAAAAIRVTDALDVGIAAHLVAVSADELSVSSSETSTTLCPNHEYRPCDSAGRLRATGYSAAASLGALLRPSPWLALGVNVRTAATVAATGTIDGQAPAATPVTVTPGDARVTTHLPWVVRAGARVIVRDGGFEAGDVEIDGTYEAWHAAEGDGPHLSIPKVNLYRDIEATLLHHYKDTFSVRAGGAINARAPGGVVTLRAGGYFDSSATDPAATRVDFDTLAKLAATLGLGYRARGFSVSAAYAEVFAADRVVTGGEYRPINGASNGRSVGASDQPLPAVNDGTYASHNRIISLGIQILVDPWIGNSRTSL